MNIFQIVTASTMIGFSGMASAQIVAANATPGPKQEGWNCFIGDCDANNPDNPDPYGDQRPPWWVRWFHWFNGGDDCPNCQESLSVLSCYNCVQANGCEQAALTWAQDFCDGQPYHRWGDYPRTPEGDNADRYYEMTSTIKLEVLRIAQHVDNGGNLRLEDIRVLDEDIVCAGDIGISKMALASVLQAWNDDHIAESDAGTIEDIAAYVGSMHVAALFGPDIHLRSTAMGFAARSGISGFYDRGKVLVGMAMLVSHQQAEGKVDPLVMRAWLRVGQ